LTNFSYSWEISSIAYSWKQNAT